MKKNGIQFKDAIFKFKEYCKDLKLYSYGNDVGIFQINYDLYNLRNPSLQKWFKSNFFDIVPYFKQKIDTSKYTSGQVYKALKIKPPTWIHVHDPNWDIYSIFLTINKLNES